MLLQHAKLKLRLLGKKRENLANHMNQNQLKPVITYTLECQPDMDPDVNNSKKKHQLFSSRLGKGLEPQGKVYCHNLRENTYILSSVP